MKMPTAKEKQEVPVEASAVQAAVIPDPKVAEIEQIERDAAKARARLLEMMKERKEAPSGMFVESYQADPRATLEAKYVPESIPVPRKPGEAPTAYNQGATMACAWTPRGDHNERHNRKVDNGWEPVRREDGTQLQQGSAFCYKRPIEFERDRIAGNENRHARHLESVDASLKAYGSENANSDTQVTRGKLGG